MGAPTVFTGCCSCFRWLLQSNKIAAAANLCGGGWGRQKGILGNFCIVCSLFLLRSDRRRNKERLIIKFSKPSFCCPHPPPGQIGCRSYFILLRQPPEMGAAAGKNSCGTYLFLQGSPRCSTIHSTWRGVKLRMPGRKPSSSSFAFSTP